MTLKSKKDESYAPPMAAVAKNITKSSFVLFRRY
ncbi:hypothetical protein CbuG_1380 [Coxiella burnetii CbuG_Q212]|nr:hypothetical protein CbuG_1380 [Coxiella burnetii CbuG_Q212]